MKRATTYSSFCSQIAVVLVVYLHLFRRKLLLKCAPQPKIAKHYKLYFGDLRSFKVIDIDTTKKLVIMIVMISSIYVPMCNRFHATEANSDKIITFGDTPI